jgi:hypothetical protein
MGEKQKKIALLKSLLFPETEVQHINSTKFKKSSI